MHNTIENGVNISLPDCLGAEGGVDKFDALCCEGFECDLGNCFCTSSRSCKVDSLATVESTASCVLNGFDCTMTGAFAVDPCRPTLKESKQHHTPAHESSAVVVSAESFSADNVGLINEEESTRLTSGEIFSRFLIGFGILLGILLVIGIIAGIIWWCISGEGERFIP